MATDNPVSVLIATLLLSLILHLLHHPGAICFAFSTTTKSSTIKMVEGHSVHRLASSFRTKLVGRAFTASSPNGRFDDGASAINGRTLTRMESVGKNLFAFFSQNKDNNGRSEDEDVVVHVHFGMSGVWAVYNNSVTEEEPEAKPTTRLRLEEIISDKKKKNHNFITTHLSAMTVTHGNHTLYTSKKASLGQDPLRSDADPELLYSKISKSKKSIGQILMDQSYFAGPGNIYRAEILFLAGVYPTTMGIALTRPSFDKVWDVSVKLLRRGYDTGSILTVDANVDPNVAARGERRYIYNKARCARCGSEVSSWNMSGRTCYACEGGICQPKSSMKIESHSSSAPSRSKKVKSRNEKNELVGAASVKGKKKKKGKKEQIELQAQPQQHVPFISHCARVGQRQRLEQGGPECLTIAEIRAVMEQIITDNDVSGSADGSSDDVITNVLPPKSARKAVHVEALSNLLQHQQQNQELKQGGEITVKAEEEEMSKVSLSLCKPLPPPLVSAEDAAREKANSGENRAVEHIAELSREQAAKALSARTPPLPMSVASSAVEVKHQRGKKKNISMNGKKTARKRTSAEEANSRENPIVEHIPKLVKSSSITTPPLSVTSAVEVKQRRTKRSVNGNGKKKSAGKRTSSVAESEPNNDDGLNNMRIPRKRRLRYDA